MKSRSPFRAYLSAYHNEVTGSRLLLVVEFPDGTVRRVLVDCGYFQEPAYRHLNYIDDLDPRDIDAIVITHNHIDHTGLLPKFVRNGYQNPIYMTEITQELCPDFLYDSCNQQEDNARDMRNRMPEYANKFNPLYYKEDVEKTIALTEGLSYRKTREILPGIKLTYFENGHILGAGMVLLQCYYPGLKSINFFFTGDYRMKNCFFEVPEFPSWLLTMPLVMVHESTYGSTSSDEIKKCFRRNMLQAFSQKMDILIGAFAQGRMQELLYFFKKMQDEGLIPEEYVIYVDGPLGIKTTSKYHKILSWYNPEVKDFLPKGVEFVTGSDRKHVLNDPRPKIVITTSGMLSNGPARTYVPIFLEKPNTMIHLVGYAAEDTLARTLLDAKRHDTVNIGGKEIKKRAIVKTTREWSSHATADQMIEFVKKFENIKLLVINHGSKESRIDFQSRALIETNAQNVALIDRDNMYVIYQNAEKSVQYDDMYIKRIPAKLNYVLPVKCDDNKNCHASHSNKNKTRRNKLHHKKTEEYMRERKEKRQAQKAEKKRIRNESKRERKNSFREWED